ncbi:MAG: DUF1456 family protein [Halioglobus sp.]
MTNNDILRRIRYVFDLNDAKMIEIFALADLEVRRGHIVSWLLKEEEHSYQECNDRMLATFLNGFITMKRGKKKGPQPKVEHTLTNNLILMKLKIALDLQSENVIAILALAEFDLSAPELSSFFRKPEHRNYRLCKDQVLRNFLMGLQISLRAKEENIPSEDNSPTEESTVKEASTVKEESIPKEKSSPYSKWSSRD